MPDFMIFRSNAGPNYTGREPAKYESVSVVTAPDPETAVKAMVGAIGLLGSYAAVPCTLVEFYSETETVRGGRLVVQDGDNLLEPARDD